MLQTCPIVPICSPPVLSWLYCSNYTQLPCHRSTPNELVFKLHNDPGFDVVTGITEAVSFQPTAIPGSGMRVCHEADPTKIVLDVLPLSQSESKSVRQPSPSAGGM